MFSNELKLSEIWIYPIKSMGGIPVTAARVLPKGLQYDRRWMLADENGTFLTQRAFPKMAGFKLIVQEDHMQIHFEQDKIEVPLTIKTGSELKVQIWNDMVLALDAGNDFSKWFTERMGMNCKLVFFPEENPRLVDPQFAIHSDHASLADAYPFLIIGQESLNDLNSRLDMPVPMNRFRPNFVFTGGEPFDEDRWKEFAIGKNRFVAVKPCSRCVLTTVNQDTGEKGVEPLKTLSTYRRVENKTYFGQNLIALDYTEVHVNDVIRT